VISQTLKLALLGGLLAGGCGNQTTWNLEDDERSDLVAFVAPHSEVPLMMAPDGSNVTTLVDRQIQPKTWPNQVRILNSVCDGWSENLGDPIELRSPDGAHLGLLDDNWSPEWSPDGSTVAVACGRKPDGTVVVVGDIESPATAGDWSRSGHGSLSDRIEIFIVAVDGTSLTRLSTNDAGDWHPRWQPNGQSILIESNRDGNSEIYQLDTNSTETWRLTNRASADQAPEWSQHGLIAAFTSDSSGGTFEVHVARPATLETDPLATGQAGRPIPWNG